MPGDRVFVDTNVIIYAYDISAGYKHEAAREIMADLWDSGSGVLSTQVLQEFFVSVTQKMPAPIGMELAKGIVTDFLKWDVVINDGESILNAIEIYKKYKYSFWDSLIIEAAVKGGCALLLSEDLSAGQNVNGVEIKNPFENENPAQTSKKSVKD
jgi:predicted nucleic acid-binding protein